MQLGTQTGSLNNHLLSRATLGQPEPTVGMGATVLSWTDRSAATIRHVFQMGNKLAVQISYDEATVISGSAHDDSAKYSYRSRLDGYLETFAFNGMTWEQYTINRDTKRWKKVKGGHGLHIGKRDHYRDPSF